MIFRVRVVYLCSGGWSAVHLFNRDMNDLSNISKFIVTTALIVQGVIILAATPTLFFLGIIAGSAGGVYHHNTAPLLSFYGVLGGPWVVLISMGAISNYLRERQRYVAACAVSLSPAIVYMMLMGALQQ